MLSDLRSHTCEAWTGENMRRCARSLGDREFLISFSEALCDLASCPFKHHPRRGIGYTINLIRIIKFLLYWQIHLIPAVFPLFPITCCLATSFPFHSTILEPYLDLRFSQHETGGELVSLWPCQIFLSLELALKRKKLMTWKRCARSPLFSIYSEISCV